MPSMGDYEYFSLFQHKGLINSKAYNYQSTKALVVRTISSTGS